MPEVSGGTHHRPVLPVMREQRCLPLIAPLSLQLPLASSSVLEPLRFITAHKAGRRLDRGAASHPGGRLSRQADRFIHRSHVAEAEKDFSLAPATTRRNEFGKRAR